MRNHFIKIFCFLMCVSSLPAQNPGIKSGVSFKKLFLDYQSQNGGGLFNFKDYRHGYEIGYQHNFSNGFSVNVPIKFGVINSISDSTEVQYTKFIGLDAVLQYSWFKPEKIVVPYVMAGGGIVKEFGGDINAQFPIGFGLQFRIAPIAYFNYQSEY